MLIGSPRPTESELADASMVGADTAFTIGGVAGATLEALAPGFLVVSETLDDPETFHQIDDPAAKTTRKETTVHPHDTILDRCVAGVGSC